MSRDSTDRSAWSRRGVTRRDFLKWTGAGIAGTAAVGSSGCSTLASGFAPAPTVGPNTIILTKGPDTTGTLAKVIKKFNSENHGFKVQWQVQAANTGQYFDKMRTVFQAVNGGDIDVIGGDIIWPAQLAANGWIEDLSNLFTKEMQRDFLPATLQTSTYKNKIYGVPWYSDAGLLYYRKDLLDKAGLKPPKTYDELMHQVKKVKQQGGIKYGFTFQGQEYEGGVCNECEYIWNCGGDVLDPNNPAKVVIDKPGGVKGHEVAQSMLQSGTAPLAVVTFAELESLFPFQTGEALFNRNWPFAYAIAAGGKEAGSLLKPEWVGVAHLPRLNAGDQGFACLGGWDFMINSFSKNKEQAWEFIKWMIRPEIQKFQPINAGFLPPRKSLFEDKQLLKKQPVMALAKSSYATTHPRPSVNPFYSDMSLDMAQTFNETLKGDTSPQGGVSQLQKELQRIADAASNIFHIGRST
jgi:multiple sugar transport system substrate-binding protein